MKPWSFEPQRQFSGIGSGLRSSYSFSLFPVSSQNSSLVALEPFLVLTHPGHIPDICAYCSFAGNGLPPMAHHLPSYGPRPTCHCLRDGFPTNPSELPFYRRVYHDIMYVFLFSLSLHCNIISVMAGTMEDLFGAPPSEPGIGPVQVSTQKCLWDKWMLSRKLWRYPNTV